MNFKVITITLSLLAATGATLVSSNHAFADETVKEKAEEAGNDTKRGTKQVVRKTKEATCPMVNGKMECAVQKVKHSVQKGADNVEDAVD